jgi:hypothetical protein
MSAKEISSLTTDPKKICGAKGKRNGKPCPRPPMANGRCYHHGGASPGNKQGSGNSNYRHGRYTATVIAERRQIRALLRASKAQLKVMTENT